MHPQLSAIESDLKHANRRIRDLSRDFDAGVWGTRPPAGGWSATDCVAHLNLTSAAYLPLLDEGLSRARAIGGGAPARFRRDLLGWVIWKSVNPEGGMKVSTRPNFVPAGGGSRDDVIAEFERLQEELLVRLRSADGLPLQRVKIPSPFEERAKYSIYSGFTVLAAHEHRHIGQAERALRSTPA